MCTTHTCLHVYPHYMQSEHQCQEAVPSSSGETEVWGRGALVIVTSSLLPGGGQWAVEFGPLATLSSARLEGVGERVRGTTALNTSSNNSRRIAPCGRRDPRWELFVLQLAVRTSQLRQGRQLGQILLLCSKRTPHRVTSRRGTKPGTQATGQL